MNNRGQFTIIAALLVAVVLIATVIVTYSSIRNTAVRDQPPIQSAIDETNFAIKQILGFTVGYYGSVLQVTGNSTYAKELARNYLQSGLVNIASMHPEWGTSFNVSSSDLYTCWFTNSSYSTGELGIMYNLTGLGISGITYETSCKLDVAVMNTIGNQAFLSVTKDENESVINLGKQNFKFYRYLSTTSTWELTNQNISIIAYANGTYQIELPPEIDPYSYVVQVEDPRGIIVVASSFSHYTCELSWNLPSKPYYAVTGSTQVITGLPDGNFTTVGKGSTTEVTDYQGGAGTIKQVHFNITYYGPSVSGTLEWYYQLDGGSWVKIEDLPQGGSVVAPLTRTHNATNLRTNWTWNNLNTTHVRFANNLNNQDAYVDSIYLTLVTESTGNDTIVVEMLQNGTMRWLGQNLQLTSQAKPIPPVSVKAMHVNQTVNGANNEVPFQIEDWNSNYQVPAGLTNNNTVFSNRQMIVFLATSNVSKITLWWDGHDNTTQTSYAYTNRYFTEDNTDKGILTNGELTLIFQNPYYLYVNGFDGANQSWTEAGSTPYLNDDQSNYISHNVNNGREGWFDFTDLTSAQARIFPARKAIKIEFECSRSGNDDYFDFLISNGTTTFGPYSITPSSSYNWQSFDLSSNITTALSANNARVEVRYRQVSGTASTVNIRRCRLVIDFGGWLTSISGNSLATADFMRINSKTPSYGSNLAYMIHHGIVRDVIHQEAEWSGGIPNCPDVYSQIIITLPANATYYTYQLRLTFVTTGQTRTISEMIPIKLTMQSGEVKTENGTLNGYPVISNATDLFYNYSASAWAHHWSQLMSGTKGVGIMFTDAANQKLYMFDPIAGNKTGGIHANATAGTIELAPIAINQASFTYALDIVWHGAVSTFDGTAKIYREENGNAIGLWTIVEYPPTVTVSTGS